MSSSFLVSDDVDHDLPGLVLPSAHALALCKDSDEPLALGRHPAGWT